MSGRRRRLVGLAVAAVLAGAGAAGCSTNNADALGHKACVEVEASLSAYREAEADRVPAAAARLRQQALSDLRGALSNAALAASGDGDWQALKATLSESSRVPESDLVGALSAQCAGR